VVTNDCYAGLGGSLGWKTRGSLDSKFEEAAFGLDTSTTASPKYAEVKTEHGYHIIMVSLRSSISILYLISPP
jgi:parvulin-like peptidyl-prolyl isomerase